MKQYTRIYLDASNNVKHVHTQETPIQHEPVDDDDVVEVVDKVIEHDGPFERASPIRKALEVRGGSLAVKASANSNALQGGALRDLDDKERSATARSSKSSRRG